MARRVQHRPRDDSHGCGDGRVGGNEWRLQACLEGAYGVASAPPGAVESSPELADRFQSLDRAYGHSRRVTHLDWPRRTAYVEPTDRGRSCRSLSQRRSAAIELPVSEDAIEGLKFSTCVPRGLARRMLARRLGDASAVRTVLAEPLRFVGVVP
jgi:hypothetical protein